MYMKSRNYIVTYLSALIIGILLLIFYRQQALYQTIVIIIGALLAVPSLVLMITMLIRRPDPAARNAGANAVAGVSTLASAAALALGIWMMCVPHFFISAIIYTLGAILLLVGLAQITFIFQASRPFRPSPVWFVVPGVTLAAGVVLILAGPARISAYAGLITGIVLVIYAANGFASAGREARLQHDMADMEREKEKEEAADRRKEVRQASRQ